jgi:N-acyl-D-amino-acid deacylase
VFDLVVRGGRVYDGTGTPPIDADVAVSDGRIVEIGDAVGSSRRVIDVDGLAVAPGFIDNHTHFDAQLLWDPAATTSCFHGITTVITGNCGLSLAPCRDDTRDALISTLGRVEAISREVLEAGIDWSWHSTAEYFDRLRCRLGVNVGALIGHCAVRHAVMGEDAVERPATDDEIRAMQQLVRDGMNAGAVGFSTNNTPRHMREDGKPVASRLADRRELDAIFGVLSDIGAGVIQNVQGFSPSTDVQTKVDFVSEIARSTGRPVLWQGIVHRWHEGEEWREALRLTELARQDDRVVMYPVTQVKAVEKRFTLENAQVFDEFPTWRTVMMVPLEQRKALLADREMRRRLSWEAVEDPARSSGSASPSSPSGRAPRCSTRSWTSPSPRTSRRVSSATALKATRRRSPRSCAART